MRKTHFEWFNVLKKMPDGSCTVVKESLPDTVAERNRDNLQNSRSPEDIVAGIRYELEKTGAPRGKPPKHGIPKRAACRNNSFSAASAGASHIIAHYSWGCALLRSASPQATAPVAPPAQKVCSIGQGTSAPGPLSRNII
jgi:hypothetical protein